LVLCTVNFNGKPKPKNQNLVKIVMILFGKKKLKNCPYCKPAKLSKTIKNGKVIIGLGNADFEGYAFGSYNYNYLIARRFRNRGITGITIFRRNLHRVNIGGSKAVLYGHIKRLYTRV
jgi:hypothetical protein